MRREAQAVLAAVGMMLVGCKATLDTATSSAVTLTAAPDPSAAATSSGVFYKISDTDTEQHEYHWKTDFSVALAETQGVGLAITSVAVKVQQAAGGIVIVPTNGTEHYQFTSSASGNRLESHGSANVGFDVLYDLPNGGHEALVTVTFTFFDDNNVSFSKSIAVRVQ
jgi:hypothetical protein